MSHVRDSYWVRWIWQTVAVRFLSRSLQNVPLVGRSLKTIDSSSSYCNISQRVAEMSRVYNSYRYWARRIRQALPVRVLSRPRSDVPRGGQSFSAIASTSSHCKIFSNVPRKGQLLSAMDSTSSRYIAVHGRKIENKVLWDGKIFLLSWEYLFWNKNDGFFSSERQ